MKIRTLVAALGAILCLGGIAQAAGRDQWIEVRSPNFIVVSNAGEGDARRVAVQFEQVRSLFRESFSYVRAHKSPVITILAVKDEGSLRELLPEFWEVKGHSHPSGLFINRFFQFQVALDLSGHGENPFEGVYHEYYHSVTTPYFRNLPVWMAEGLAEFYGKTNFDGKDASVGLPSAALINELASHSLIPFETLFRVDHGSPYYNEQSKVSIFYAESWALVHYLMLGDKQAHRPALGLYLAELDRGATPEQAAARAFGDLARLQADLQRYLRGLAFPYLKIPAPARISPNEIRARALSDAEADAYRGGFLVMHGQFKYAQPLLQNAAALDPNLALAHENLALLHYGEGRFPEALAVLSSAIRLNPNNAHTRYLRASLDSSSSGSPSRNSQIEVDLRQAVAADPDFAPPYAFLSAHLVALGENLPEALDLAQKGVALEPGRSEYQFSWAQALGRIGRYDEAEGIVRRIRSGALDAREREQSDSLLALLVQAREFDARRQQQQQTAVNSARELGEALSPATAGEPGAGSAPEPRIVLRRRTNRTKGLVTQVSCKGDEMQLTLKTDADSITLHSADVTQVDYTSSLPARPADLAPCIDLKGRTVAVTTIDSPRPGEITRIDITQ